MKEVGEDVFKYCERLKSVQLNEGLEKLGKFAFSGTAIETIELPSTLKRIEVETFSWCGDLKRVEIPNGVEYIGEKCFYGSAITEITLPNTLKEMGENTFNGCKNLLVCGAGLLLRYRRTRS